MTTVLGNVYDKYNTRNPIARQLMRGYLVSITELYNHINPFSVLEVGCGEGTLADYLIQHAVKRPGRFEACDLSLDVVAGGLDPLIRFSESSIYELPYADRSFDLVACCEVLEHIEYPLKGLAEVSRVAAKGVLLSAPWEPVWRILNIARGKYITAFGNTPGHINHFSRQGLIALAGIHLKIVKKRTPLPWTLLLGVPRT